LYQESQVNRNHSQVRVYLPSSAILRLIFTFGGPLADASNQGKGVCGVRDPQFVNDPQ
jgi:hypothetical protein